MDSPTAQHRDITARWIKSSAFVVVVVSAQCPVGGHWRIGIDMKKIMDALELPLKYPLLFKGS